MSIACPLEPLLTLGQTGSDAVCTGSLPPWPLLILGLAFGAASLWAIARTGRRGRIAGAGWRRRLGQAALTLVLLLAAWLAALDPVLERRPPQSAPHWAAAVDISASMKRDEAAFAERMDSFARLLREAAATMPRGMAEAATASLTVFGGEARSLERGLTLEALAARIASLPSALPPDVDPQGSSLAEGLDVAGRELARSGQPGAVLLLSDGLETATAPAANAPSAPEDAPPTALDAAEALARQGLPVHVAPAMAGPPQQGLVAVHVPGQATIAAPVDVRLVLDAAPPAPGSSEPAEGDAPPTVDTVVRWQSAGGSGESTVAVEAGAPTVAQLPLRFDRRGLHRITVEVEQGGRVQKRDLSVQIGGPVRLGVLGDAAWTAVLPEAAVTVTRLDATQPFDPAAFDGMVLDGVPAATLAPGMLQALADGVRYRGLGLLLVNGPIRGRTTDPVVLESYEKTPLEPLLPLLSAVRPEEQRRGRRIAIAIDTSGSMGGWPLEAAQKVAASIVDQLRQADRLSIIAFSADDLPLLEDVPMTMAGKKEAQEILGSLSANGGTDPTSAVERIGRTLRPPCGMFLISDGGFGAELRQPGCMTTSIAIGTPGNPQMAALGDVISINPGDDLGRVKLAFFSPPPRPRRFEPGNFIPDSLDPRGRYAPHPALPLAGNAVMQSRDTADIVMTRPWPVDPILAFGTDTGTGAVGQFTTAVPAEWAATPGGAQALGEMVARLVSFRDADRYLAQIRPGERGQATAFLTPLAGEALAVSELERIDATLVLADGARSPLVLQSDADAPERLRALLPPVTEQMAAQGAVIEIIEQGRDAAADPIRLPVDLGLALGTAAAGDAVGTAEAARGGQDELLLRGVAAAGAGLFDFDAGALAAAQPSLPAERLRLWPLLLALAAAAWAGSVAVGRLR